MPGQKTPNTLSGVPVFCLDAYVIFIDFPNFMFFSTFFPNFHRSQSSQRQISGRVLCVFARQKRAKTHPGDPAGRIIAFIHPVEPPKTPYSVKVID